MIQKRILSLVLTLVLLCSLDFALAADDPGSVKNPLVSKSYVDTTFQNAVMTGALQNLSDSMRVLEYKLSQAGQTKSGVAYATAMPKARVSLAPGAGFSIAFGYGRLSASSGTVLDLTEGTVVAAGETLKSGHRYLAAENTNATATAVTGMKLALYGSVGVQSGGGLSFVDVPDTVWHFPNVAYAATNKLVNGRSATAYEPEANLSIAEAIKLAACMHQLHHQGSVSLQNHTDPVIWYQTYVDYAAQIGIVSKTYPDYNAAITRSEFVAVFYNALPSAEYPVVNTVGDDKIPDVRLADTNAQQIYAFYRAGLVNGSDASGNFLPTSNIKRSEVATIVTRMFEKDARVSIKL